MCRLLGGLINDYSHWPFQMKLPPLEINHRIGVDSFLISAELTNKSKGLYNRNITFFGKTPTKNTIIASMLQMADIKPYEVVYDPMCGVGSVPIEVGTNVDYLPNLAFGSDIFGPCLRSFEGNLETFRKFGRPNQRQLELSHVNMFQADATNLPLRDSSIDCIISDLPFGKRIGSKKSNREIFLPFFNDLARVTRPENGRAVVMTTDRQGVRQAIESKLNGKYWKFADFKCVNHGNIKVAIWLIKRSAKVFVR